MSQFTIQEMKDRIMGAAQAYYKGEIEEAWVWYVLATSGPSEYVRCSISGEFGCSRYREAATDKLNRLVEERDGFIRDVENMNDANITSLYAEIFNATVS